MLNENDVVEAVCAYLANDGFDVVSRCSTKQKGTDIVARRGSQVLHVEAKGSTSSEPRSKKFGREFDSNQSKTHVGVAILHAMNLRSRHPDDRVAIALPRTDKHKRLLVPIVGSLGKVGIDVVWVDEDRAVQFGGAT